MSPQKVNLILIVLVDVAIVFLFLSYFTLRSNVATESRRIDELERRPLSVSTQVISPEAGESGRVVPSATPFATATPLVLSPVPSSTPKTTTSPEPTSGVKRITYIPLYGGGMQTTDTNWIDVPGSDFQMKASDYGATAYFNWEAIAWVIGGSGQAKLRIYDVSNNVVVSGSDISATSASRSLVSSGRLNFFSGNNTYRIQISSQTSSPAQFDFGRVKVVY